MKLERSYLGIVALLAAAAPVACEPQADGRWDR